MGLDWEMRGSVAWLQMDDGKVNALDNAWFARLQSLLDEVEASDANALVIAGREGIYSGGLNVKWLPTMAPAEYAEFNRAFPAAILRIRDFPKPTIAAMTGHAIAGGCLIACACDRRLARAGMRMAMNEVRINMVIPQWAIYIIEEVFPRPWAMDLLQHGDPVATDTAAELGVIRQLFEDDSAMFEAALALGESYADIDASAYAGTKARVRRGW